MGSGGQSRAAARVIPRENSKRHQQMKHYYVYIMTNRSKTLYIGVTNNLQRRMYEHKHHLVAGFTSTYSITRLVYFEETSDVNAALAREKHIKGWVRASKIALSEAINPDWRDLMHECQVAGPWPRTTGPCADVPRTSAHALRSD